MARSGVGSGITLKMLLKLGLFLGSSLLVVAVFAFTQQIISGLSREVATTSRLLARFCAQASFPAARDPRIRGIVAEVINNIDFPMIITDQEGTPRAWRQVGLDPELVPSESIDSLTMRFTIAPVIRERLRRVELQVAALDRKNPPIPMMRDDTLRIGLVHYGDPAVLERLRWMPLVSVAGVLALLSIGLWGLAVLRQAEKRTIWVGMAKETAHQLGTPLSSLMGWTELLRTHQRAAPPGEVVPVPSGELEEITAEMERDIERLNRVAQRFSHVGSAPKLELQDVTPVVQSVVQYMRRRMPQGAGGVEIHERYQEVPPVRLNPELVAWALENLMTNALSALDKRPGVIEVSVGPRRHGHSVEVVVSDNGRGMSPAERRRAFEPGFTTKRRGWGLGLALARRVVQEYHGGRIYIAQTVPGQGTTLVVQLPG